MRSFSRLQVNQTRILSWSFPKSVLAVFTPRLSCWTLFPVLVLFASWEFRITHIRKTQLHQFGLLAVTEVCSTLFLDASGFLAVDNRIDHFSINRKPLCSYPSSLDFWKLTIDVSVRCFRRENPELWLFCMEATSTKATIEHLRFALAKHSLLLIRKHQSLCLLGCWTNWPLLPPGGPLESLGESLLKQPWGPSRLIKSNSFLVTRPALIQHADYLELEDNLPPYGLVFFFWFFSTRISPPLSKGSIRYHNCLATCLSP